MVLKNPPSPRMVCKLSKTLGDLGKELIFCIWSKWNVIGRYNSHAFLPTFSGSPVTCARSSWPSRCPQHLVQIAIRVLPSCMSVNPSRRCFPPPKPCLIHLSVISPSAEPARTWWLGRHVRCLNRGTHEGLLVTVLVLSLLVTNLVFTGTDDVLNQQVGLLLLYEVCPKSLSNLHLHRAQSTKSETYSRNRSIWNHANLLISGT